MQQQFRFFVSVFCLVVLLTGCDDHAKSTDQANTALTRSSEPASSGTERMVRRLALIADTTDPMQNGFMNRERVALLRQLAISSTDQQPKERVAAEFRLANELLRAGDSEAAVAHFRELLNLVQQQPSAFSMDLPRQLRSLLAVSLLRIGEQLNCVALPNSRSCLFPINQDGIHLFQLGSREAMKELAILLRSDPDDLVSRWLYNVAAMTVGEHPHAVPEKWLISLDTFAPDYDVGQFSNVAPLVGLDTMDLAGGSIIEDFDGDGYLDVMASSWGMRGQLRLFRNKRNDGFEEITHEAGLTGIFGGLNIVQADYDNDGDADVLVLRGAWLVRSGRHPNSLLRNNGHGVFEDVTEQAGLLSFHPTQAGAWGDYDNDGWLDLYIGNESNPREYHPSELYRNNSDGTFTNVATLAGVEVGGYIKGVVWGDYDNDGWLDLYVSRMGSRNLLFHNERVTGQVVFREVGREAGVTDPLYSFPTWFWDYDNDGWLDLFVTDYPPNAFATDEAPSFSEAQPYQVIGDYLRLRQPSTTPRLYRNNRNGTFTNVTEKVGLAHPTLAMGANFGDIDNDGYPDIYLGTGAPDFRTLLPNRMFRNAAGQSFQDVTTSSITGHLQKGHGISFGDLDNDGDQDIFAVMGGAFSGDVYQNALFANPGHGNHWITLRLQGVRSNRSAIGARLRITVATPTGEQHIFATVGSGGSFGASSLQQEIGLGSATVIRALEINWPGSGQQVFRDLPVDRVVTIREGRAEPVVISLEQFQLGQGSP
ncbi:MAG: CRTAC1 family protein [Candidatus Competibacteraceae bacterium]|jgi:hypothetical protein|nr:CRTAC1 family protein [Candidatus Competibacteraceae bacterium]